MIFGLKNVNFDHSHIGASSIKNILILGLILLSMARKMSKYVAKNKLWPIWGLLGYLCCLNHLRVKLTHARVITSFQTLPEIGLNHLNHLRLFQAQLGHGNPDNMFCLGVNFYVNKIQPITLAVSNSRLHLDLPMMMQENHLIRWCLTQLLST